MLLLLSPPCTSINGVIPCFFPPFNPPPIRALLSPPELNSVKMMGLTLAHYGYSVSFTVVVVLLLLPRFCSADDDERLMVPMTLVRDADDAGAVCLDGSLPAYHLRRGSGAGATNWLLQFEGGGWCNDVDSCLIRAGTRRGSTTLMNKQEVFSGILSNNVSLNPDFYNWNRVKLRYCDGASFTGDSQFRNESSVLYFRGQRIWDAIITDLLPKGLADASKALLSGCSAGGLSVFHHCDDFSRKLPNATVKCLTDAGFFLDAKDISSNYTMRTFYEDLVTLQGSEKNLNEDCKASLANPKLCFFPQYALRYITAPFFLLNSAYDVYQINHILVPPSADVQGLWNNCKTQLSECSTAQINLLQGFRREMLRAMLFVYRGSSRDGMFINSCFSHCQSELQPTWLTLESPTIHNKVHQSYSFFVFCFDTILNILVE
ncbi:unnamed protein product [Linum tenue]|uniref:Pectin acetylesterase n=2 Tax=Linum tenue TaxID=586396 RepID=A0AAV0J072_9ROSI|nr:unnamed protein product [Linum tenue]